MYVLGAHSYTHDVSTALSIDGKITHALEEERISRKKHHLGIEAEGSPPRQAITSVLHDAGIPLEAVDRIVHVGWEGSEYLKMDFAGSRFREFARELDPGGKKTRFISHHLAHAASAYYSSGFDRALVLAVDGVGDFISTSLWLGTGESLKRIDQYTMEDSLGFFYGKAARILGLGKFGYGEGKMTPLACREIPGGVHSDGTARVQLVHDQQDPFYHLISAFAEKTGVPAVLNTSLNARDEPLCTTIDDAIKFYYTTPTDQLIIGNWWVRKT